MKIKINKKSHELKPACELTVSEYIDYFKALKKDSNNLERLINYVSIATNVNYKNVADIDIDYDSIRRIFAYVGEVVQANDLPVTEMFYHKKSGKTLYAKSLNWRTIGARKMLEDRKADTQIEQAVYLLAVYISGNYDAEKSEEIYNELQDYNSIEVFSFIIFFFKNLQTGKSSGRTFLKKLLKNRNTKTVR